jgi:hypothetical protein
VRWAGLAIPNPTSSADSNYNASILFCSHILAAFRGVGTFRSADHLTVITEVKAELKLRNEAKDESEMIFLTSKLSCDHKPISGGCRCYHDRQYTAWNSPLQSSVMLYFYGMLGALLPYHYTLMDASNSSAFDMSAKQAVS